MSNLQLIRQHHWRNEHARKNQFHRTNLYKFAFIMHLDFCDVGALNNKEPSQQNFSSHFQKNSQTLHLLSFQNSHAKDQKKTNLTKLAALKGPTALFFSNDLSVHSKQISNHLENPVMILGLINKDFFFNRLDISKLLQLEKNQVELLTNRLNSFGI